jgi:hypothetical protein
MQRSRALREQRRLLGSATGTRAGGRCYGFGAAASTFALFRRRRAASACFFRRFTLGFM